MINVWDEFNQAREKTTKAIALDLVNLTPSEFAKVSEAILLVVDVIALKLATESVMRDNATEQLSKEIESLQTRIITLEAKSKTRMIRLIPKLESGKNEP